MRFWTCFFLFVRVTVEVTFERWTLQMHISCRIYGAIRQHTGQIFECFRHGDHILCHLGFSKYFYLSSFFLALVSFLIDFGKTKLASLHIRMSKCKEWIGIWREEKELLKIKLNLLSWPFDWSLVLERLELHHVTLISLNANAK